ncbi:MAG: hypothetical protein AB1696_20115 [Planctomycetota bacterium]
MGRVLWVMAAVGALVLMVQWNVCGQEEKKPVFQKMDADGDGKVTADEFTARRKAWFKEMDGDADGKVTADEYLAGVFEKINADDDETLELDEFIIFFVGAENKDKKNAEPCKDESKTTFEQMDGADGDKIITVDEMVLYFEGRFKAMDANGDGKVTKEEHAAHKDKGHKKMDANGDGVIVIEEMVVMPAKE